MEGCDDVEDREKYHSLSEKATDVIENVKHAIVLLKIAKVGYFSICVEKEGQSYLYECIEKLSIL